jgi:hypothetical protein
MRDPEIRQRLRQRLEIEFGNDPTALILDELGVCCGQVRADMAVVNGELKGFEIKSDRDTLLRLRSQVSDYCKVFDTVSIVVGTKHFGKARKMVPRWWGVLIAEVRPSLGLEIECFRQEKRNPNPDPMSIAQLIWRDEAFQLLKAHGIDSGLRNRPRRFLWRALVNNFPTDHLQMLVRNQLKARRDWRSAEPRKQDDAKSRPSSM